VLNTAGEVARLAFHRWLKGVGKDVTWSPHWQSTAFADRNPAERKPNAVLIPRDVPLRILANADGAEVLLTLFRQPRMSEEKFLEDAEWVKRDLLALKALVTR
jgi:hypothetical protein